MTTNGNPERVRRASGAGSAVGLGSRVGSAVHCSGVTSDNGPAVNGPAVTSRNCVLDPRKNETLDVVTSKSIPVSVFPPKAPQ